MSNFFFWHPVFKKQSDAEASVSIYMRERVYTFPHINTFWRICSRQFLKTWWQKEKFPFCHNVFSSYSMLKDYHVIYRLSQDIWGHNFQWKLRYNLTVKTIQNSSILFLLVHITFVLVGILYIFINTYMQNKLNLFINLQIYFNVCAEKWLISLLATTFSGLFNNYPFF